MSCIASAVSRVIASGLTFRNVPTAVSTVSTPSVVTSRYCVVSGPRGSSSVYEKAVGAGDSAMAATVVTMMRFTGSRSSGRLGP